MGDSCGAARGFAPVVKVLILAAGYGTRMQGVIGDRPKALVEVGGRTILDWLMARLDACCDERDRIIVTNARYFEKFAAWREAHHSAVTLLNDGTLSAETRLGAVADIRFALQCEAVHDDVLVIAADNIFDFDLTGMVDAFDAHGGKYTIAAIRHNPDLEDQKRRGVVELDAGNRLVSFVEKPQAPTSHWAAAPLYLFPARLLPVIDAFVAAGGNVDAPGHLLEYLVKEEPVYGWPMPGRILDVGNPESLAIARAATGEGNDESH